MKKIIFIIFTISLLLSSCRYYAPTVYIENDIEYAKNEQNDK